MSNCTQQSEGCQKGRPIKAGRLYYMKLLLITVILIVIVIVYKYFKLLKKIFLG